MILILIRKVEWRTPPVLFQTGRNSRPKCTAGKGRQAEAQTVCKPRLQRHVKTLSHACTYKHKAARGLSPSHFLRSYVKHTMVKTHMEKAKTFKMYNLMMWRHTCTFCTDFYYGIYLIWTCYGAFTTDGLHLWVFIVLPSKSIQFSLFSITTHIIVFLLAFSPSISIRQGHESLQPRRVIKRTHRNSTACTSVCPATCAATCRISAKKWQNTNLPWGLQT